MREHDDWTANLGTVVPADEAVRLLQRPAAELLAIGGDGRQVPVAGRNSYGFPLADLNPVVRGSSCTSTPPDARALLAATSWAERVRTAIERNHALPDIEELRAPIAARIADALGLGLEADRSLLLTASGTDAETLVAALLMAASERPLRNIVLGAREAGSGTALAASGRVFSDRSPFCARREIGTGLDGFPSEAVTVVDVELRDARGRERRPFDVEAEVEAHSEHALEVGEQVVVHAMAGSKTDLRYLDVDWVRRWNLRGDGRLHVVVDAAQGRISPSEVRAYLQAGATVSLTGSKFIGAPPFCGAVILGRALAEGAVRAVAQGAKLPAGMSGTFSSADLPLGLRTLLQDAEPVNLGLLARWEVALHEVQLTRSIPAADRMIFLAEVIHQVRDGLARIPRLRAVPHGGNASTILAFGVLDAGGRPMEKHRMGDVYRAMVNQPGVQIGQPVELAPGGPAALRFAVGLPTISRALLDGSEPAQAARRTATVVLSVLEDFVSQSLRN